MKNTIICFSHLRWDFVWQRPQQILSRISKQEQVIFVEEPLTVLGTPENKAYLEVSAGGNAENLTVIRLIYPTDNLTWIGHGDERTQAIYSELLIKYLKNEKLFDSETSPDLWLYTPMALAFVPVIPHQILIYDVMDQLSAFNGAPPLLLQLEEQLLRQADLVFTGGVSLYEAKKGYNTETFLFPSGVEIEHFAKASNRAEFSKPEEVAQLSGSILGYYGVIDERMDVALLAHIAQAHPEWNLLILGPLAKIEKEELPTAPNLYYPGIKTYEQLPGYLAFFDVALIPFALTEATRYLSPTKTLEYLAAHKRIVSTALVDVIKLYGEVVQVAYSYEDFVKEIETALCSNEDPSRQKKEDDILQQYTWDNIVASMLEKIRTAKYIVLEAKKPVKL